MKKCFAPSEFIRPPLLDQKTCEKIWKLIGAMAEGVIGTAYLTKEVKRPAWYPVPPALDFHDANRGIASRTMYVSFICDRNPGVDQQKVARLATEKGIPGPDGQLLCIPDFMSHGPPQMFRYYEVKPGIPSDANADGEMKVACVHAFMQSLGLLYEPGTTWDAEGRFVLYIGLVLGYKVTVSFEYKRHDRIQGLVVYHFCIEIDNFVPAWAILLILALVIIAVLFPEFIILIPELIPELEIPEFAIPEFA
jgi:hypothetical protein